MINVYEQIDRNKRKSALVVVLFVIFVTLVVYIFSLTLEASLSWIGVALIFAGLTSLGGYYWGDKVILAISGARPATREKNFQFYTVVENLCLAAQIPKPKLYVIEDSAPNAFAAGRDPDHAVVCATSGLLNKLDRSELEGVIAHELSHIKNYDIRLMSIVTVLVGMVSLLADWFMRSTYWGGRKRYRDKRGNLQAFLFITAIFLALLSPLIARFIQLAISRRREFLADASAVMLTRYPEGLARALGKISADRDPLEVANKATAHLYIVNPLKGQKFVSWFANLFNTHPPIKERIKTLKEM